MSLSRREILALGAVAAPAGLLLAQPPARPRPLPGGTPPTPPTPPTRIPAGRDPLLAACLLIGHRGQVEACQWAMTRLTNDEAKAFAKANRRAGGDQGG